MTALLTLDDLLTVAKRENNSKRAYLYVNPCQGKHVPVSPSISLDLFQSLSRLLEENYKSENLLVIGFAETATGIGSAVALNAKNVSAYISTTRENVAGAEYLFFTESHSHATEQRLVVNSLEQYLSNVQRIVFAEDEVTTGNTIQKLINALESKYPSFGIKFGIISILNSMSSERLSELNSQGIQVNYLFQIPSQYRSSEIHGYHYLPLHDTVYEISNPITAQYEFVSSWNPRCVADTYTIKEECQHFLAFLDSEGVLKITDQRILVLGTEEFMYPGMLAAKEIENSAPCSFVRFHATTRSPIETSNDPLYPLKSRCSLDSLYESGRKTFVYNLEEYDRVIIVTDSDMHNSTGLNNLVGALNKYGNKTICLVRWRTQ